MDPRRKGKNGTYRCNTTAKLHQILWPKAQGFVFIHGADELGRSHGGEGERTGGSTKEMARLGGAGRSSVFSGLFPAAGLCSGEIRGATARAGTFLARRRGGNGRRKKKASPAPLFIGEAW